MRFVATPARTHYVSLWAGAPSQCQPGDSSVPGDPRECIVAASDELNITVFFAEFFPQVRAVAELSPGAGGSASVEGLENGAKVSLGTTVTFIAAPDADSYVGGWSRAECSEIGDGDNPGVEKKCVLVANQNLIVTATLLPPPSLQTIFYGNVYENAGDEETIPASSQLGVEALAHFEGIRRGLAMMRITVDGVDRTRDIINAGNFASIRAFCEGGGFGWRLPTFSEAAGIVSTAPGPNRLDAVETINNLAHIPGLPVNMPARATGRINVTLPAPLVGSDAAVPPVGSGVIADLLAVVSGADVRPVYFTETGGTPQALVGSTDTLGLICVRSFDESYSPQNIAGIEVNGLTVNADGIISLTVRAAPQTPGGESYGTITLGAWRFADDGSRARANVDISYTADLADVEVVETGAGREILGLRPASGDFAVATIVAYPPVGRTITARVELTMDAARILFNGETIRQLNQDVNVIVPLAAPDESMSVRMSYHGTRRGVHILRSEAWALKERRDGSTPNP